MGQRTSSPLTSRGSDASQTSSLVAHNGEGSVQNGHTVASTTSTVGKPPLSGLAAQSQGKGKERQVEVTPPVAKKKKNRSCGYFPRNDKADLKLTGPLRLARRRGSRTTIAVPDHLREAKEEAVPTFEECYTLEQEIGKGCSAIVRVCVSKATGAKHAVKIIEKSKLPDPKMLDNEVRVMKRLKHPNIIELIDTFETETHLLLVIELATGGELFDRIVAQGSYTEKEASKILYDVTSAVGFLHQCNIVHRDLKPENILFSHKGDDAVVKLADFGFSTMVNDPDASMDCGTVEYVAPEILTRTSCQPTSDVWSIGVIMYILLCGFHPFYHENRVQFMRYIVAADYEFPDPEWSHISESAKDLIRKLLVVDPNERPSCEEVLRHPWITGNAAPENELSLQMVNNMQAFAKRQRQERRRRRNIWALGSIARKLYGEDSEQYNKFMRRHNYSALADHAISMAVYGAESAEEDDYNELLTSLQDMTEQEMIEQVASQLFTDDKSREDFLNVSI